MFLSFLFHYFPLFISNISLFACHFLFLRPIRPGQFGYGRVPYSLPLHRQNRHTRHAHRHGNATAKPPQVRGTASTQELDSRHEENEEQTATKLKERQRKRSIIKRAPPPPSAPFSSPLHRPHPLPDPSVYAPPPYVPSPVVPSQHYKCAGKDREIRKCTVEVRALTFSD